MTKEEAIEILKTYKEESEEDYWVMRAKALDMAISALSENKGEWIPVSERLPEKSGEYLIAIKDRLYTQVSWFYPYDKKWSFGNAYVIAWAYIPERYKAEGGE